MELHVAKIIIIHLSVEKQHVRFIYSYFCYPEYQTGLANMFIVFGNCLSLPVTFHGFKRYTKIGINQ